MADSERKLGTSMSAEIPKRHCFSLSVAKENDVLAYEPDSQRPPFSQLSRRKGRIPVFLKSGRWNSFTRGGNL